MVNKLMYSWSIFVSCGVISLAVTFGNNSGNLKCARVDVFRNMYLFRDFI
jgi:hypothetical protein